MRILFAAIIALTSVTIAHAESFIPTKDRVKLELWIEGVETRPAVSEAAPTKELPEEITRILLKYKL